MDVSGEGSGDITRAFNDNPDGLKKWLKIRRGESTGEPAKTAETPMQGATPESIAAFAEGAKARKASRHKPAKRRRRLPWRSLS